MRKKIITTIVMIGMFLLVVASVSAVTLKITPSSLVLNGEPNTKICSKLTIESSIPDGIVEVRDSFEGSIDISYNKSLTVMGSKDVDVCVTSPSKGLYPGYLIYRTIKPGGSIGVELKVKTTADTTIPDFKENEVKKISAFQTVLEIITNEDISGRVTISKHEEIANPGKILLGDLIEINALEVENKLKSVTIKKYYTIEQLNKNSLDEDSLKLYYYNNGNWEGLNSVVYKNVQPKYVSAVVNHFSIFGIFGNVLGAPSKPVVVDDGDSTLSTTSLHAQWSSNSVGSDIFEYMYAIGTGPGATNIVYWTSITQTSVTETGLNLNVGTTYYFSVKARNEDGWSEVGVSNGIEIIKSSSSGGGGSSGGSSSSSGSEDFSSINLGDTIAKITGGLINLGGSESDENNKSGDFLIVILIILLILIALIIILSVKKSKKKVLSK